MEELSRDRKHWILAGLVVNSVGLGVVIGMLGAMVVAGEGGWVFIMLAIIGAMLSWLARGSYVVIRSILLGEEKRRSV